MLFHKRTVLLQQVYAAAFCLPGLPVNSLVSNPPSTDSDLCPCQQKVAGRESELHGYFQVWYLVP